MRKLISLMLLYGSILAGAQATSPQNSFSSTLLQAQPSLYLNFNDMTTSFLDKISTDRFTNTDTVTTTTTAGVSPPVNFQTSAGFAVFTNAPLAFGTLSSFTLQYFTACPAGPLTMAIATVSGSTLTITNSFTVEVADTTAVQTFVGGVNYTAPTVSAGQVFGFWTPNSGCAIGDDSTEVGGIGRIYVAGASSLPTGANTYASSATTEALTATVTSSTTDTSGTVIPRQPGFDSKLINNTAAEFPWNGFNIAPNDTLGSSMEWDTPWTLFVQVDRLNWNRSGELVLASKGDSSDSFTNNYWALYLQMSGDVSQLCFARNGAGPNYFSGSASGASNTICTSSTAGYDAMPNGFNYDIMVTDNGTGNSGSALSLYINGLNGTFIPQAVASFPEGFGYVTLTPSGSGTGYANSTAFTSKGGGANCVVAGTMSASNGVPTGISGLSADYGCTSVPTIVFTSPTGTGETIAAAVSGASMQANNEPLLIPGEVYAGVSHGITGNTGTSAQAPTYIDEAAIFPTTLSQTAIQGIFYWTKFYQTLLNAPPSNPINVFFDDDGCQDEDNFWALQGVIAEQNLGYIRLVGVVQDDTDGLAAATFRQMLDQAGLSNVPVGIPPTGAASPGCVASNLTTYNASTPLVATAYPTAASVYREALAANPSSPVYIISAGPMTGLANLLTSSADSISPLTGQQLWNQDAANGAAVYSQGGDCFFPPRGLPCVGGIGGNMADDYPSAQIVMENKGSMPMYWVSGMPADSGPGPLYTRTSKDPMFLFSTTYGTDVRPGYDSLPVVGLVSPYFDGGVQAILNGGVIGSIPPIQNGSFAADWVGINAQPMTSGTLSSISLQFQTTPSGSSPLTIGFFSGIPPNLTPVSSFTVTPAANTNVQTFEGGGVNFPTTSCIAGDYIGAWSPTLGPGYGGSSIQSYYIEGQTSFPTTTLTYIAGSGIALTATCSPVAGSSYANATYFTISGSGSTPGNCTGQGIMTASGGVPTGITTLWSGNANGTYYGLGSGCLPDTNPVATFVSPTGTGASITLIPTGFCGADTVTETSGVWSDSFTSATCNGEYILPFTQYANPPNTGGSGDEFTWFLNSLIDPVPRATPRRQ